MATSKFTKHIQKYRDSLTPKKEKKDREVSKQEVPKQTPVPKK